MKKHLPRILWLIAVGLYLVALALRLAAPRPLGFGDLVGPVCLAVVGWAVLRRPRP